jgi:hypothetical protein
MARVKALCVVAHPDDCVIFAKPFIDVHDRFDWNILYLTYAQFEPRGKEIAEYWANQGIVTIHLGFTDDYRDMENDALSFNHEQAAREIANICKDYDLVLTHNPDGDYGHIHHKFVSQCATASGKPMVYFAAEGQENQRCVAKNKVKLEELPLHREVIEQFGHIDLGRYLVTDTAKELVNGKFKTGSDIHL